MGRFDSVYEKNEIRQVLYIKNTKFTVETIPYFLELFIQVSEHLLTQIKGMAPASNHAIVKSDSRQLLSENANNFTNDMTLTDDIYKAKLDHEPSSKHKLVKPKATYHNLPVTMGESILEHLSSQHGLYEKVWTCQLTLNHGARAIKASVLVDSWLVDDEQSRRRLNVITRLTHIANSIAKIKLDAKKNVKLYQKAKDTKEFIEKWCPTLTNLETIVFASRLLAVPLFSTFNLPVNVKELKLLGDPEGNYGISYLRRVCETIFKSNNFLQRITLFRSNENSQVTRRYTRADFH